MIFVACCACTNKEVFNDEPLPCIDATTVSPFEESRTSVSSARPAEMRPTLSSTLKAAMSLRNMPTTLTAATMPDAAAATVSETCLQSRK